MLWGGWSSTFKVRVYNGVYAHDEGFRIPFFLAEKSSLATKNTLPALVEKELGETSPQRKAHHFWKWIPIGFVGLYTGWIPCPIGDGFQWLKTEVEKNPTLNKPSSLAQKANSFCFCPPPQVQHEVEFPVDVALGFVTVFRLLLRYLCKTTNPQDVSTLNLGLPQVVNVYT